MTALIFESRKALAMVRIVLVAATGLLLAACQTDGTGAAAAGAPKAEAATAKLEGDAPRTAAAIREAPTPPEPVKEPEEPMTRARAARECWMRTEKGSAHENLDKRADIVNKCIDDKMKAAGAPAPKT